MSFVQGFEKTAGIPEMVGGLKGTIQRGTSAIGRGFKKWRTDVATRTMDASRAARNPTASRPIGASVAPKLQAKAEQAAGRRLTSNEAQGVAESARSKVMDRYKRMNDFKKGNKPSFAKKHPYLTAGGAFLAGRYAFGGGPQQDQGPQNPVVYQPQG
jgi:hypothetical protein